MYGVIHKFKDLESNDHIYEVGDEYPIAGVEPTNKRIDELSTSKNKLGVPLIKKVMITFPANEESVIDKKEAKKKKN